MAEIDDEKLLAGRNVIDAYREAHSRLEPAEAGRAIDHSEITDKMHSDLKKIGFASLQDYENAERAEGLNLDVGIAMEKLQGLTLHFSKEHERSRPTAEGEKQRRDKVRSGEFGGHVSFLYFDIEKPFITYTAWARPDHFHLDFCKAHGIEFYDDHLTQGPPGFIQTGLAVGFLFSKDVFPYASVSHAFMSQVVGQMLAELGITTILRDDDHTCLIVNGRIIASTAHRLEEGINRSIFLLRCDYDKELERQVLWEPYRRVRLMIGGVERYFENTSVKAEIGQAPSAEETRQLFASSLQSLGLTLDYELVSPVFEPDSALPVEES